MTKLVGLVRHAASPLYYSILLSIAKTTNKAEPSTGTRRGTPATTRATLINCNKSGTTGTCTTRPDISRDRVEKIRYPSYKGSQERRESAKQIKPSQRPLQVDNRTIGLEQSRPVSHHITACFLSHNRYTRRLHLLYQAKQLTYYKSSRKIPHQNNIEFLSH